MTASAAGLEAAFLYLGSSDSEAQEVANDPGRGGLVILAPWQTGQGWFALGLVAK